MRATVLGDSHFLGIEEVDIPSIEDDEVLIKPERSGICPSGVDAVSEGTTWGFDRPVGFPGHEFSGTVVDTGGAVDYFESGDHVVANLQVPCGHCHYCQTNRENLCLDFGGLGYFAHAEYVKALAKQTYKVPAGTSHDEAVFTEPVACVYRSISAADVPPTGNAVVIGAGQMGLLHMKVLKSLSTLDVLVTDLREDRLDRAKRLGADRVEPADADLESRINHFFGDEPVDSVFVTVGSQRVQEGAFEFVDKGGTVVFFAGIHSETTPAITIDPNQIHYDSVSVVGTTGKRLSDFVRARDIIAKGDLGLEQLITDRLPLAEVNTGMEAVTDQQTIKTVINPQE